MTDHVAASWAARVTASSTTTRIKEPKVAVRPGETWTFASDVKAVSTASVQITVAWYSASGTYLSYSSGPAVAGVSQTSWKRFAASVAVPTGAAQGETWVNILNGTNKQYIQVTQHDVRAPAAPVNQAPVASFTSSVTGLGVSVNGAGSSDADGSVSSYSWNWGDGTAAGSGVSASHTYAAAGTYPVTLTVTDNAGASGTATQSVAVSQTSTTVTNLPGQPALTVYGASTGLSAYASPGALVIAGRDNYADPGFQEISAAGGTVLVYLDAIINASYGRYHDMLLNASPCGAAVPLWPGNYTANQWGQLNDFRVGGVLQGKLRCVLEAIVAENPHIGGFFADDLGSRSWFPNINWSTFPDQQGYRDGAIALAQTFHDVAAAHGLMVMVNGTWGAGTLASSGGGYPNMNTPGLSLADGGYIEHHSAGEVSYFTSYAQGQWGTAPGSVSQGKPFMYVQASTDADRAAYQNAGVFAYLSTQSDYGVYPAPWGAFHPTGLPSRVTK